MLEFVKLNVKKCDATIIDQIPFWDATERESLLEFIKMNIKKWGKVWVNVEEYGTHWDIITYLILYNFYTHINILTNPIFLYTRSKPFPKNVKGYYTWNRVKIC